MDNEQHVCKLDTSAFAMAAAWAVGVFYFICAIFVALWHDLALKLVGWVWHLLNIGEIAGDVQVTFGSFLVGLVQVVIYSYIAAWFFAWLYNKFSK